MQLKEVIKIDRRFQKSVNLQLDIGDMKRVESYIPTRASVEILKRYLKNIQKSNGENASILIGPYGKGKSHLLLVLLAILEGKNNELISIVDKIEKIDVDTANLIKDFWEQDKKFLPVLVSDGRRELNQTFLLALKEALERKNLHDIVPESSYTEALKVLKNWKKEYPQVYADLEKLLSERQSSAGILKKGLANMEPEALRTFEECYPFLTAGSVFAPMVQMEALKVYREVNRQLTEQYGYAGIIIIFDEFSKYIEGHAKEGFSGDMKTLQDMCELANTSEEQSLSMILVAHKSIHEYEKGIDRTVKNAFRGVEGRLKEIPFVITARNNYELIADSIQKKEPQFSEGLKQLREQKEIEELIEKSYHMSCFHQLFSEQREYERIIVYGCFPLTPLCAYALLHISEKVAQNERTIFTFLTGGEQNSLPRMIEHGGQILIGIDAVYDYFKPLFKESSDQPKIHNEWLKADYALKRVDTAEEKKIIKAVAVIQMIHQEEEFSAKDEVIRLALGMPEDIYVKAIQQLKQQNILIYRKSRGVYAFKNNVGVDIEKEIAKEIRKQSEHFPICEYLNQTSELEYELPKQYNQKQCMTRYFKYEYVSQESYLQMQTTEYLFEEQFSDGKILALVCTNKIEKEKIVEKSKSFSDDRIVAVIPDNCFSQVENVKRLAAVRSLIQQPEFLEENKVLKSELELYEEDLVFEINAAIEEDFSPGNGKCCVVYRGDRQQRFESTAEFNRCLSEIFESYYCFSPKVNHELLNVQNIGSQYLRARNKVVEAVLGENAEIYENGTAPECMVYRAAFLRTGMIGNKFPKDEGCSRILKEIGQFFQQCSGERHSFGELYSRLQGKNYGVRKGILPLFIAWKLVMTEGIPVIYLQKKELEITADTLNRVNDFPGEYELYIEAEGAKKEQYLERLEKVWRVKDSAVSTKSNRWVMIMTEMQKWYRSLPQYAMTTRDFESEKLRSICSFRNLLKKAEVNPREDLFEKMPEIVGAGDLKEAAERLEQIKLELEHVLGKVQQKSADAIREIFGANQGENLKACLISWYQQQKDTIKNYLLGTSAENFVHYIEQMSTNDETEIVAQISKRVLDIYMEDWKDETFEEFKKEIREIKNEVESAKEDSIGEGTRTIIFTDASGKQIQKSYSADAEENSTGIYLKNMIDEAIEEFADTLETNQKVAVLVEVLEKLLQ